MFSPPLPDRPPEQVPEGIDPTPPPRSYSTDRVHPYCALPADQRTFAVSPRHEALPNGVRFAVETVSPADKADRCRPVLGADQLADAQHAASKLFYSRSGADSFGGYKTDFTPMRIEASAELPGTMVHAGPDGFMVAVLTAFARHLPLALSPDLIWAVIGSGFARHVDAHAEELRANFVQHEGKKRLEVQVGDGFAMGGGVPGLGAPARLWEELVFPNFSGQIREHIGQEVHEAIAGGFSTTDAVSQAAHEVTLMAAMKSYFSFGMTTCCGIPEITLHGSLADWQAVRDRAERLGKLMRPEFSSQWMTALLPVLDQFVMAYQGEVNHGFWQSMVKLRSTGGGSGSYSFISGWVQLLFPYLASGSTSSFRPWDQMYYTGPQLSEFPPVLSSAPVDWNHYGAVHDLHFHAGVAGVTQNPEDGTLMPQLGWFVSHDPPQQPHARLGKVQAELEALRAGHQGEPECGPWHDRVIVLENEAEQLEALNEVTARQERIDLLRKERSRQWDKQQPEVEQELKSLQAEQSEAVKRLKTANSA